MPFIFQVQSIQSIKSNLEYLKGLALIFQNGAYLQKCEFPKFCKQASNLDTFQAYMVKYQTSSN